MILLDLAVGVGIIVAAIFLIAVLADTVGSVGGFFTDPYTSRESKFTIIGVLVGFLVIATIVGAIARWIAS